MAVEDWVDEIAKLFEIADGKGGTVKSYRVFEKNEFPAALDKFPCALTYTVDSESVYSTGGPNLDYWNGITDFHITPDLDKSKLPYVMQFFKRIRNAAASNMTLNGKVSWFQLRTTSSGGGPSIQGPVEMSYGDEAPHHGLRVFWQVKENVTGAYTPGEYILDEEGNRIITEESG